MIINIHSDNYKNLDKEVLGGIVRVGQRAFGESMDGNEILEHILPTDRLYLARENNILQGFATANINLESIHLEGTAVDPEYQGRGLYRKFTCEIIDLALDQSKQAITMRTQNPKIELGVRRTISDYIRQGLIQAYDVDRNIQKAAYGRILTSKKPLSSSFLMNARYKVLNYERGDAFELKFRFVKSEVQE
jgi:GNAT superfamily N-acetyltransferase